MKKKQIVVMADEAFFKELTRYARIKYRTTPKQFLETAANLVMKQNGLTDKEIAKDEANYPDE